MAAGREPTPSAAVVDTQSVSLAIAMLSHAIQRRLASGTTDDEIARAGGEALPVVRARTVDLLVPATSQYVLEGWVDPERLEHERDGRQRQRDGRLARRHDTAIERRRDGPQRRRLGNRWSREVDEGSAAGTEDSGLTPVRPNGNGRSPSAKTFVGQQEQDQGA